MLIMVQIVETECCKNSCHGVFNVSDLQAWAPTNKSFSTQEYFLPLFWPFWGHCNKGAVKHVVSSPSPTLELL